MMIDDNDNYDGDDDDYDDEDKDDDDEDLDDNWSRLYAPCSLLLASTAHVDTSESNPLK